jgi:hypothetical protein
MVGRELFCSVSGREECERSEQGKKVLDPIDEPPPLAMARHREEGRSTGGQKRA